MDNELSITGKNYTTEFREYNADVGRWWTLDPKPTASESWYAGMGNNPILFTDVKGDVIKKALMAVVNTVRESYNTLLNNTKDEVVKANLTKELEKFNKGVEELEKSEVIYDMGSYDTQNLASNKEGGKTYYSTKDNSVKMDLKHMTITSRLEFSSNARHELEHMFQFETGKLSFNKTGMIGGFLQDRKDEAEAFDAGSIFGYNKNAYSIDNDFNINFNSGYEKYNNIKQQPFGLFDNEGKLIGRENVSIFNLSAGDINDAKERLDKNGDIYNENIESQDNGN